MKSFFYNKIIYTHVMLFTSIFDEMEVWNYDAEGKAVERIPVPVKLAYKEKVISQILKGNYRNPNAFRDNENVLPMISIEWKGLNYDRERARGQREKRRLYIEYDTEESICSPTQKVHLDIQTVPYKMTFEVTIWAKYMDHLVQLIENIDPFLHPEIYLSFYEKGMGIERKIKVQKISENGNFKPDIGPDEFRSSFLMWRMTFDVECNLYKPELPVGNPIKRVVVRFSSSQAKTNTGIELAEVVNAETQDSDTVTALTSSGSGCQDICYSDLDAEIVSFIRNYVDEEYNIIEELQPYINCQLSPQDITPPPFPALPYPKFPHGNLELNTTDNTYTIQSTDLGNSYNVVIIIYNENGTQTNIPFNVNKSENQFDIILDQIPVISGYNLIWYTYPIYNNQG